MPASYAPNYVPIEDARKMPGLRVAFTRGVPGTWSVAIKAILDIKGIDYIPVAQEPGEANEPLKDWTGQTSAPVAMFNDDRPRPHWSEMLALAEQLKPEPRLVPADENDRIIMLGLCHEICSEDGLGWNNRLLLLSGDPDSEEEPGDNPLRAKYRSPVTNSHARDRVLSIIRALATRLENQAALGSRYFIGDSLTAADIYWAAFSNIVSPMTSDICEMPDSYRGLGPILQKHLKDPLPQILFDHRDYIVGKYFNIPIAL